MSRVLWFADEFRDAGLKVVEVSGWEDRGYDTYLDEGVLQHHTASSRYGGNAPALGICTYGRSDLPGPLCQVLWGRDGTAFIVASGKANHAGYGGPWKNVPLDSGNSYLIGFEIENDGIGEVWSAPLLDAVALGTAVCLRHFGHDESYAIGHREWTTRKPDPSYPPTMIQRRAAAKAYLEEDDMTADQAASLARVEAFIVGVDTHLGPLEPGAKGSRLDAGKALATKINSIEEKLDELLARP